MTEQRDLVDRRAETLFGSFHKMYRMAAQPDYEPDPNVIGVMKYLNYGNTPAQNCKGDFMDKMWKI